MIEILHGQLKNRQPADEQAVQDRKGDQGSEPSDPLPRPIQESLPALSGFSKCQMR
jgi:hypothetical protein